MIHVTEFSNYTADAKLLHLEEEHGENFRDDIDYADMNETEHDRYHATFHATKETAMTTPATLKVTVEIPFAAAEHFTAEIQRRVGYAATALAYSATQTMLADELTIENAPELIVRVRSVEWMNEAGWYNDDENYLADGWIVTGEMKDIDPTGGGEVPVTEYPSAAGGDYGFDI